MPQLGLSCNTFKYFGMVTVFRMVTELCVATWFFLSPLIFSNHNLIILSVISFSLSVSLQGNYYSPSVSWCSFWCSYCWAKVSLSPGRGLNFFAACVCVCIHVFPQAYVFLRLWSLSPCVYVYATTVSQCEAHTVTVTISIYDNVRCQSKSQLVHWVWCVDELLHLGNVTDWCCWVVNLMLFLCFFYTFLVCSCFCCLARLKWHLLRTAVISGNMHNRWFTGTSAYIYLTPDWTNAQLSVVFPVVQFPFSIPNPVNKNASWNVFCFLSPAVLCEKGPNHAF